VVGVNQVIEELAVAVAAAVLLAAVEVQVEVSPIGLMVETVEMAVSEVLVHIDLIY
tara:strand:+ start:335 stop:502 length:168 start_codon:yes stop_codon:yes gene_type:complete